VSEIFISYATVDRALATQLAGFLQEKGYSVWWDRELAAGEQFYSKLAKALAGCKVAIVIWTVASVESRWVLGEADTAASADKLIPVREDALPDRELPVGFRALHTIPLSDREGLLRGIRSHFEAAPKKLSRWTIFKMRVARRLLRLRQSMTPGKLVVMSAVLACGTYFFWILTDWLAIKDSMELSDFQHHLKAYPLSPFAPWVRLKLAGSEEWELVKKSRAPEELRVYIEKFPGSLYYSFAVLLLNRLEAIASGKYSPVLLPNSSRRVLDPEEINSLNCTKLWTARNEIYYSVGYCFSSEAAINAFRQARTECPDDNCKLFKKFNALAQDIISNTENENISKLRRREQELGCRVPERVVGICSQ